MREQAVLDRNGVSNDSPSMVHLVDEPDAMVAICGAKLLGEDAWNEAIDCVVCAELDRLGF